jgi:hypothetical protein
MKVLSYLIATNPLFVKLGAATVRVLRATRA